MRADEMRVYYGTTGAELECMEAKCKFRETLPYPMISLSELNKLAKKHEKEHR
jgi:hypothetical protein